VNLYPHQAAQAKHQLWSICTVYTPLGACHQQCQRRLRSVAPNCHGERNSPQTAGYINISNYSSLKTIKLHVRKIWLFTVYSDVLNPLSVENWLLRKIQLKIWICFPTLNNLKTLHTHSINHCCHLCHKLKDTHPLALYWAIKLASHGNLTHRIALRRTYKTIPTICLWCVKSTIISSVGSRWRAWKETMTKC